MICTLSCTGLILRRTDGSTLLAAPGRPFNDGPPAADGFDPVSSSYRDRTSAWRNPCKWTGRHSPCGVRKPVVTNSSCHRQRSASARPANRWAQPKDLPQHRTHPQIDIAAALGLGAVHGFLLRLARHQAPLADAILVVVAGNTFCRLARCAHQPSALMQCF